MNTIEKRRLSEDAYKVGCNKRFYLAWLEYVCTKKGYDLQQYGRQWNVDHVYSTSERHSPEAPTNVFHWTNCMPLLCHENSEKGTTIDQQAIAARPQPYEYVKRIPSNQERCDVHALLWYLNNSSGLVGNGSKDAPSPSSSSLALCQATLRAVTHAHRSSIITCRS